MRVLITGSLGVNGAAVLRELLERGHDVHAVDNRDDVELVADLVDYVPLYRADVRDLGQVSKVMAEARPQVVVHTAAIIGAEDEPLAALDVNVLGSAVVLDAAAEAGVRRVVHHSSRAVYGEISGRNAYPHYEPVDEDHPQAPRAMYDITKRATEDVARWYAHKRGFEFVALRFATILAAGKLKRHGGYSTLSSIIELPAEGQPVRIERGGDERDDVVYIRDVATATAAAVEVPRAAHDAYNISSGRTHSLHELADEVRSRIPAADIQIGPGLDPMNMGVSYYSALDNSRALLDLGWSPSFGLADLVKDYLDTLRRPRVSVAKRQTEELHP